MTMRVDSREDDALAEPASRAPESIVPIATLPGLAAQAQSVRVRRLVFAASRVSLKNAEKCRFERIWPIQTTFFGFSVAFMMESWLQPGRIACLGYGH
jgi:hypothetical protein